MVTCDFLIAGGGIIGICLARELRTRHPNAKIIVLEKEAEVGGHASGRNSGVIHAGFYYTVDSLKARFTREGNRRLTEFCEAHKLPLNKCGKLVVAQNEAELAQLDELLRRGARNGVTLHSISAEEARKIEPRVKTFQRAIFSPATSTSDPLAVLKAMAGQAESEGIEIRRGVAYLSRGEGEIRTSAGAFSAGYFLNAAGLYADCIALDFGFSEKYRIAPFKGLFLYSDEPAGAYRTNIYPVPDLRNPFLGVHFTLLASGHAKIGPTAIPALWREQYKGFENFRLSELWEIVWRDLGLMFFSSFDFKRLAFEETLKYSRARLVRLASDLAAGVELKNFTRWGKAGIRAQLVNIQTRKLEMDFVVEGDDRSCHVLNAVSPAWTCSLPFAEYVCDKAGEFLRK